MLETICTNCEMGEHDRCQGGQKPPQGMMGGWHCYCKGECVDGRYCPPQFKNLTKAIEEKLKG